MAHFKVAMEKLRELEFSSPSDILHTNQTEKTMTFYGIYRYYHSDWSGWQRVDEVLARVGVMKEASRILYQDEWLEGKVMQFYKSNFWDKMKLDYVNSQKIAEELFCFAVNADIKPAVKLAQRLLGITVDGIIGNKTLKALNNYDEALFDVRYDALERQYYEELVKSNPSKAMFLKGWHYRAKAV